MPVVPRVYSDCHDRHLWPKIDAPVFLFMRPESASGLYWSIRGTVLCGRHAKDVEDARWAAEEWQPLPESSQGLQHYQCQRCSPDGIALADSRARSRHSNGK